MFEYLNLSEKSVDILRVIDKIEKIGKESVIRELNELGVEKNKIDTIINFIEIDRNIRWKDRKIKKIRNYNRYF